MNYLYLIVRKFTVKDKNEGTMKFIGVHASIQGGVENAPLNAKAMNAKSFAFFTKNQRRWIAKPYTEKNINIFKQNCKDAGYLPEHILPHDGYLINLGHPTKDGLEKSRETFLDEIQRCNQLGLKMLNFHPGSSLKSPIRKGIETVADSLNISLNKTSNVTLVIENTAGQGNNIGFEFEQLATIIDKVEDKKRIGVCIDTCHLFAAGYDITTKETFDKTIDKFDNIVGLKYLKGFHLNDSKKTLGSRVDRHESIGKGVIGIDAFKFIMDDLRFDNIPMILETPDQNIWKEEIKLLYGFVQKSL